MKTSVRLILSFGIGLVLVGLWLVSDARAIDSVVKIGKAPRISGKVTSVTATEVTIDASGAVQKIPVTEIEAVEFEGETPELKQARSALRTGGDQNALTYLDKIKADAATKKEIKQDLAFYRAQAQARMALRGAGNVKNAGAEVFNFVNQNADSYHFLQAQEILGELLVADGNVDAALKAFTVLDQSPFDEFKMRAGVARGRALTTQKKFPEALAEFEKVLALPFNPMTQKGTPAESQRFAAVLGKAQCQANTGAYDEAIKELEGNVIPNLSPEESKLQAAAYNTLGNCYNQKPDGKKAALLAFLHVDVLYRIVPSEHPEALWNLHHLWIELGKNERGQECLTTLTRMYPGSPWVTKKR